MDDNEKDDSSSVSAMTKREWFAGMAMQGMLATNKSITSEYLAIVSFNRADAMIKELKK